MENTEAATNNFLNWVEIKNFKSIKDLRLDCKRVNVFIGKPNVGKSNILEGLGLLGIDFRDGSFLKKFIRYQKVSELFNENNTDTAIEVATSQQTLRMVNVDKATRTRYEVMVDDLELVTMNEVGEVLSEVEYLPHFDVKKYDFKGLTSFPSDFTGYLIPPDGPNLFALLRKNTDLLNEFAQLFQEFDQELVLDVQDQFFELQRRNGYFANKFPYANISDTFQRYIFYLAAVELNKQSSIILEEPEVHSFPPYTHTLAYRIIYSDQNQFFVSTHSPYLLHTFIENMGIADLNVYITYFQDNETKVKALTEDELRHVLDYSTNIFFNLRKFEPNA